MELSDFEIEHSAYEKHLGVHFDKRLTFDYYISELCKKTSKNVNALATVNQNMDLSKRKILMQRRI